MYEAVAQTEGYTWHCILLLLRLPSQLAAQFRRRLDYGFNTAPWQAILSGICISGWAHRTAILYSCYLYVHYLIPIPVEPASTQGTDRT